MLVKVPTTRYEKHAYPAEGEMRFQLMAFVALGLVIAPVAEAQGVKIDTRKDLLVFAYSWPKQVAAIPALDQWLRGNKEYQKRHYYNLARQEYHEDSYGFTTYFYRQKWRVVADTRSLLVLSADVHINLGGAHGGDSPATIIWDKAEGRRLSTTALLDPTALARVAQAGFCKRLDAQREKRGVTISPDWNQCTWLERQEIVPVSKSGKAIDTIRIRIAQGVVGGESEGMHTVDLPINVSMMRAVKPAWKNAFSAT